MIPRRVALEGFLSYQYAEEFDFSEGELWMLSGRNGAGKSAVFDAILYSLYGIHRGGKQYAEQLINRKSDAFKVAFEFEAAGSIYRAERSVNRRGGKGFGLYRKGDPNPLVGTTSASGFEDKIQEILGLNEKTFTTSVLLQQGRSEQILECLKTNNRGANEAVDLLKQIVPLTQYEEIHEKARERQKFAKADADVAKRERDRLPELTDAQIAEAEAAAVKAEEAVTAAKKQLERLVELVVHAENWETRHTEQETIQRNLDAVNALLRAAATIRAQAARWEHLDRLIPTRKRLEAAQADARKIEEELNRQKGLLASLPDAERLKMAIEDGREAALQLPYWEAILTAEGGLAEREKRRVQETAKVQGLRPQDELTAARNQAQQARELLPYLETIAAELERATIAQKAVSEVAPRLAEAEEAEKSARTTLEMAVENERKATDRFGAARQLLTEKKTLLQTARKAHDLLASSEGKATCEYCGQTIPPEKWQQAMDAVCTGRDAAQQEADGAAEALAHAESAHKEAAQAKSRRETDLQQASRESQARERERDAAQKQAQDATKRITDAEAKLPSGFSLTVDEARKLASTLDERSTDLRAWEKYGNAVRELEAETRLFTEQRDNALAFLKDRPAWTLDEVKRLKAALPAAEMNADARARAQAEVDKLTEILAVHQKSVADAQAALPSNPERETSVPKLEAEQRDLLGAKEKAVLLDGANTRREELEANLDRCNGYIAAIPQEARRPKAEVEAEKKAADGMLKSQQNAHQETDADWKKKVADQKRRQECEEFAARLENKAKQWDELARLLGQDRLQGWLMKSAEEAIVEYANEALDAFSQGTLRLENQNTATDAALNLCCHNTEVADEPLSISMLSGSQRFRTAVSLALGIGRFASRNTHRIQSVIIDEGFGSLDTISQQEMSKEFANLTAYLDRIIVVSHQETFADAFPNRFEIRLDNQRSVVRRV